MPAIITHLLNLLLQVNGCGFVTHYTGKERPSFFYSAVVEAIASIPTLNTAAILRMIK